MVTWIKDKFGSDAVAWFFFTAVIFLGVMGIGWTVFFAVSGFLAGLAVSIPAIFVGFVGFFLSGTLLDDNGYI